MPSEGIPGPPAGDDLQFDRAEYTAAAPGSVVCTSCARPIADVYYETGGKVLCETCVRGIDAHFRGGSRGLRFLKAAGFGFAAAVGGAVLVYLCRQLTGGFGAGLLSILAGYMVGSAVRQGTGYRGGRVYQFLALFLTYSALSWSTLPYVVGALSNGDHQAAQAEGRAIQRGLGARPGGQGNRGAQGGPVAEKVAEGVVVEWPKSLPLRILYGVAILSLLLAFSYSVPIQVIVANLPQSLFTLLFFFWALQQAWQLTRRVSIDFRGPFRVGGGPSPPEVPVHA